MNIYNPHTTQDSIMRMFPEIQYQNMGIPTYTPIMPIQQPVSDKPLLIKTQAGERVDPCEDQADANAIMDKIRSKVKIKRGRKPKSAKELVRDDDTKKELLNNTNISAYIKSEGNKIKNRESARNSRKRKKLYIELLEKQVVDLTHEVNKYKKIAEECQKKLLSFPPLLNNFIEEKHSLYEKLEKMIEENCNETDLTLAIDSLRLRYGSAGEKRLNFLEVLYKYFIDSLIPIHFKYLLYTAQEGKDFFSQSNKSGGKGDSQADFFAEMIAEIGGLLPEQSLRFQKFRRNIMTEKQKMNNTIYEMTSLKNNLLVQANQLQNIVDELRTFFTPKQIGKFLIFMDKKKTCKELAPENLWNGFQTSKIELDDAIIGEIEHCVPYKLVKSPNNSYQNIQNAFGSSYGNFLVNNLASMDDLNDKNDQTKFFNNNLGDFFEMKEFDSVFNLLKEEEVQKK